jgi:hypothetical protein
MRVVRRSSRALSACHGAVPPCRVGRYLAPVVDMVNYAPWNETRTMDSGAFYLEYHKVWPSVTSILAPRHHHHMSLAL